jgi:hypothetical protein
MNPASLARRAPPVWPPALGAKWLKIIFVMWQRQVPYDEQYHLATMTRPQLGQLRQPQKQIA